MSEKKTKEKIQISENILMVVVQKDGTKKVYKAENIVTNDGDTYYAQRVCTETPTYTFANCVLGTGAVAAAKTDTYDNITPIAGSNKAKSTGYPKTNDADTDNTGAGVDIITWLFSWAAADFNNAAIREGVITIASPIAGSKILTKWVWAAAFAKDADTTLKLFVNHTANGV